MLAASFLASMGGGYIATTMMLTTDCAGLGTYIGQGGNLSREISCRLFTPSVSNSIAIYSHNTVHSGMRLEYGLYGIYCLKMKQFPKLLYTYTVLAHDF